MWRPRERIPRERQFIGRQHFSGSGRFWALARDAKEVLCWSCLVEAQNALANLAPSLFQGEGSSESDAEHPSPNLSPQGERDKTFAAACTTLESGLKIARDCGFGLYHIDLLLERSRLYLLRGDAQAALVDIEMALGDEAGGGGIPANEETGQPELLADRHPDCGYAWAIPAGLQLLAEAVLLQFAQDLDTDSFVPAKLNKLSASGQTRIAEATGYLEEAMSLWQPLHDPEPERKEQNFHLDSQDYNYKARETHGILTDLKEGLLTRSPLEPVEVLTNESEPPPSERNLDMTKRFHVALSFPGEHRVFVSDIADALAKKLTKGKVFYDRWYEAELARPNLDTYLQKIYHDDADLIVIFLCEAYDQKDWCHLEARAIRDLIKNRQDDHIIFVRVDDGDVSGVFSVDGYVDATAGRPRKLPRSFERG